MSVLVEIKERLNIFKGFYDHIRVVDPHKKVVIQADDSKHTIRRVNTDGNCFDFWDQKGMCKNCVAYRAFYENRMMTKFERKGQIFYMTIAVPVEYKGEVYIVELFKEIDDSNYFIDADFKAPMPMQSTIMSLNDLANTDALTGVFNRRYIDYQLEQELRYNHFHQEELSILLIDIDYFKKINDQYGHLKGDQVLIAFVEILQRGLRREMDWVGRYGGEEFVIVLNRTSFKSACLVAERIRHRVEKEKIVIDGVEISLTCSIGVASAKQEREEWAQIIERADTNLYRAKMAGRNRVVAMLD